MEEALRQSEQRFAAAFHTTNAGFVLSRAADGAILDANQAWLDMVGCSRDEVIGRVTRDPALHVGVSEGGHLDANPNQAGSTWIPELLVTRKDGQIRVQSVCSREVTLQGERCHLATVQDITELVNARRALEAALAREKELAEERDETRVQLVRLLAHEIRNPMAGLKGLAQLVEMRATDDQVRHLGRLMAGEVDRLSRMLTDVLDAFRMQAGSLPVDFRTVDLAGIVEAALDLHRSGGTHDYQVSIDRPVTVMGDAVRLEDVIRNLLANAEKYSSPGSPIQVQLSIQNHRARLSIRDRGVGVPADQLDRIFDLFFRASNVAFRGPGGTGLGLYLCKNIVEQHGGRIWAESEEGKGSVFWVELLLDTSAREAWAQGVTPVRLTGRRAAAAGRD